MPVAARIARFTGSSLLLVQVISPPVDYSGGWYLVPLINQEDIDEEMSSATTYLQALATSRMFAGLDVKIEASFGLPVQQLLASAAEAQIDLIVLCSHGRTGIMRWVMGSVARSLVHQSTLPLLVLRQQEISSAQAPIDSAGSFCTLVPLDGSHLAEAALGPAAQVTAALATAGQGTLHLSQVVKTSATAEEWGVNTGNEEALQRARTYLSQVEERLATEEKDLGLALIYSVELAPDVATALLDLAEQREAGEKNEDNLCGLIALSTHGRGGLERLVMGSVTERLLNTTKLPMLIVRPPAEAKS